MTNIYSPLEFCDSHCHHNLHKNIFHQNLLSRHKKKKFDFIICNIFFIISVLLLTLLQGLL